MREMILTEWQARWDASQKGRTTYRYLPDIRARLALIEFNPNYYVTQFLTGHGHFKAYLCGKIHKKPSEFCEPCGKYDSVQHAFRDCLLSLDLQAEIENLFTMEPSRLAGPAHPLRDPGSDSEIRDDADAKDQLIRAL